ncbi:MAG: ABC transporter ATP-binding protein [Planctomycetes bacterium]|nr:ABC transporter ATP-binding protein [Planctomycetota bacterium]
MISESTGTGDAGKDVGLTEVPTTLRRNQDPKKKEKPAKATLTHEAPLLEARNLTKKYNNLIALKEVSFELGRGDIFGLIGPNGAGKSTLIKIFATLLKPTYGIALIEGKNIIQDPYYARPRLGYMPDFFGLYEELAVSEYLRFFASAYGIKGKTRERTIDYVLELTDLVVKKDEPVTALSRGMQQRLGLARVLLHDPVLMLLDEPASGLDPRARVEMKELLRTLGSMGKTIVVSSHILSELQEICTKVGIIEKGELLYCGKVEELRNLKRRGDVIQIRVNADETVKLKDHLRRIRGVADILSDDENMVRIRVDEAQTNLSHVASEIIAGGFSLRHFCVEEMSLEELFLKFTRGDVQ